MTHAHRPEPLLDPDLVAQIDAALAPEAPAPALQQRVKRQLLRRVAAASTASHLTLDPAGGAWQPFVDGIQIKVLHEDGGVMSYLLRLEPGAALPAHRHPVDEECVVLEGEVQIGSLRVGAGGYHLGLHGVLHDTLRSAGGATVFLRGAVPEPTLLI